MIPLPFGIRPVGLPENRCDFHCVQITHGRPVHLLYRNARNLAALRDRQWFAMCDKGEEAVDGSQTTVAGADGYFLSFSRCCKNASTSAASRSDSDSAVISRRLRSETKRTNSFHVSRYDITVGAGQISLLPHPFVEERMQQLCEGIRFQSDPPVFCSVAAPFFRKRSLASCSSSGVMFR